MTRAERRLHAIEFRIIYEKGKHEDPPMTKTDACLLYLRRYGSVTPREALDAFDSMRLAVLIDTLRKRGLDIVTKYPPEGIRYAIYTLEGEDYE